MKKKVGDDQQYFQKMTLEDGLMDIIPNAPKKVEKEKHKYTYIGPVYRYDTLVIESYEKTTMAISEAQALNNILFNVKKKLGYTPGASGIKLTGKIYLDK